MQSDKSIKCLKCESTKFVKHGVTPKGVQRFKCLDCLKTWTDGRKSLHNIDLSYISQLYLGGKTTRELVKYYPTSPVRVNHRVRTFLNECPDWHDYIDRFLPIRKTKQLFISGKKFHCSWAGGESNDMYVAFAIDSMTGFILAYQLSCNDSQDVWAALFDNLKKRNINTHSFLTNGSDNSQKVLDIYYPDVDKRITYHKNYRDREIGCCLSRLSPSEKLISDSAKIYFVNGNLMLADILGYKTESQLYSFLLRNQEEFTDIVKERLNQRTKLYNDNIPILFQKRFEKFHLLREDPVPLINSWVANMMLSPDAKGISRLALYTQKPYLLSFKDFTENKIAKPEHDGISINYLEKLLLEVTARGLELPIYVSECSFDIGKCLLVS
ncbi:MAG: IS1 family transposase [Candidatus Kapabacteria bacterium]|nr:IS1 family transposase [Ignavibacteriota bacterium]MCW5884264.1 IS1 family transposase [Candidatus Kapabacteria bacterium]